MKVIGVICPFEYGFKVWKSRKGIGQCDRNYVRISEADHLMGLEFSEILFGDDFSMVSPDVIRSAHNRVR